ncbi:MAG: 16S rRNA (cytosine(1402)-N(4))-methyltransferase RsmH [Nitrospirota bacterium]
MDVRHLPVMRDEVIELLNPRRDGTYVDATIGPGGHAEQIVKILGSGGRLVGIDRDEEALRTARERLADERIILIRGRFSDMESLLFQEGISQVDGILMDLGVSMVQMKDVRRGFSFLSDERLDMRMDVGQKITAWDVVNRYPEKEIERILREFGEERLSKKIAKAILRQRNRKAIDTCAELSGIIQGAYGGRGRMHPATRTFQALRIEVNKELDQLSAGLDASLRLLKRGGRLCVISYHSLEDRTVKRFFAENARKGLVRILTKKPLIAQPEEIRANPSSRSAKLRAAERSDA